MMTMDKCPFCGAPSNWEQVLQRGGQRGDPAWRPWEKSNYRTFGLGDVSALPAGAEYERRRPVRDPAVESDVITPGLQSLISGAVGGLLCGAGAGLVGWSRPVLIGAVGGAGFLGLAWAVLLGEHRRLLWEIERVSGADLDGDGAVGVPGVPEAKTTRVEVTERTNGHTRMRFVDVPLSDAELEAVARAVLVQRERFSRRGLSGVLTQSQYADVYDAMLNGGLLRDRSDGRGVELSPSGRAFLGQYID